jgi:hypothetical protein
VISSVALLEKKPSSGVLRMSSKRIQSQKGPEHTASLNLESISSQPLPRESIKDGEKIEISNAKPKSGMVSVVQKKLTNKMQQQKNLEGGKEGEEDPFESGRSYHYSDES